MAPSYFTALAMATAVALGGCATPQSGSGGRAGAPGMTKAPHCPMHGGAAGASMHCPMMHGQGSHPPLPGAMAKIMPTQGQQAAGVATFHETAGGTLLHVRVTGLKPRAEHGFHVHERGDCSAPDASSAGGHFNPDGKPHGAQDADRHAGDLPNLKADEQGNAEMRLVLPGLSLSPGTSSILDRALVIHAMPDDYRSQPAGNSGARIACGVISSPVPPPR